MDNEASSDFKKLAEAYICKMKGGRCSDLSSINWKSLSASAIGSLLGIGLIAWLNTFYEIPLLVPSFGASAVLLYAACHVPMAQPRNVLGGHLVSAAAGVLTYYILGNSWWTIAVGVTLAMVTMNLTHTLHPPGGATAFMAVYTGQGFGFIFLPIGVGALFLIFIALLVNNCSSERKYPQYWF